MHGFICSSPIYRYEKWTFEIHSYCGPCPLTVDYDPYVNIPPRFWEMIDRFNELSIKEKEKLKVHNSGCQRV